MVTSVFVLWKAFLDIPCIVLVIHQINIVIIKYFNYGKFCFVNSYLGQFAAQTIEIGQANNSTGNTPAATKVLFPR